MDDAKICLHFRLDDRATFFLCFSFCTTTGFHDKDIFDAAAMAITGSWPCGALVAGPHASLHDGLQSEKSLMLVWKDA